MKKTPRLSETEWRVMKLLWAHSPQPAYDIAQALAPTEKWHPNTVKTILSRLLRKKVVKVEKYKNLFLYSPAVSEEACIRVESECFLDYVFDGAVKPLLLHFARQRKLTREDLNELKRLLDQ